MASKTHKAFHSRWKSLKKDILKIQMFLDDILNGEREREREDKERKVTNKRDIAR